MFSLFSKKERPDLAIDLGTANTRIVMAQEGIVFDQPSICCFHGPARNGKFLSSGLEAASMRGHTTGDLELVRPLKRGVLVDIDAAHHFLKDAIRIGTGSKRISALRVIIGIPVDATKAERNALQTAAMDVGLKSVQLCDEPLAAAMGAGVDITLPNGTLLVECGAGITEAAIFSLGGICGYRSVRMGGDTLDQSIIDFLYSKFKFRIGETTAERVKCELLDLLGNAPAASSLMEIKGLNLLTGLPEILTLSSGELAPVVNSHVAHITDLVADLLNEASPDLCQDIHTNGILLTGGSGSVNIIGKALTHSTGLHTYIANDEKNCVADGLLHALRH